MKTIVMMLIALLSLQFTASPALAENILVDFEDAALAQANFAGLNQGFYVVTPYDGRRNSGSISTNWYTRQNYKGKAFDFSKVNTAITVSSFFHLSVNNPPGYQTGRTYGEVYLVPSASDLGGNISKAFVRFGIRYPSGGVLSDNIFGGSLGASGSFPGFNRDYPVGTFKPGAWYELKVTFTNLGTTIRYDIMIDEYDAEGRNFVKNVVNASETTADSFGLTKDTEIYPGFAFEAAGAKVADDFAISIPDQKTCEGMFTQAELDQAVANAVSQTAAAKNLVIEEQSRKIAALEATISGLQADLASRTALLARQEATIREQTEKIAALQATISGLQADLATRNALLAEKDATIEQLKNERDDLLCRCPQNRVKTRHTLTCRKK